RVNTASEGRGVRQLSRTRSSKLNSTWPEFKHPVASNFLAQFQLCYRQIRRKSYEKVGFDYRHSRVAGSICSSCTSRSPGRLWSRPCEWSYRWRGDRWDSLERLRLRAGVWLLRRVCAGLLWRLCPGLLRWIRTLLRLLVWLSARVSSGLWLLCRAALLWRLAPGSAVRQ